MVFVRTISILPFCGGGADSTSASPRAVPTSATAARSAAAAAAVAGTTEWSGAVARPVPVRPSRSVLIADEEYSPARDINCGLGLARARNVHIATKSSVALDSASSWGCSAAVLAAHEPGPCFAVAAAAVASAVAALGLAPRESVPEPGSPVRLGFLLRAEMAKEGQHIQAWRGGRRVLAKAESSREDRVATCRGMQLKNRFGKGFGGL
mmetsp:Transcript_52188/g.149567  ORF Transcript_52188/g.149567 Transcript_52188/m.149567 type:complete len:209 (-) Transcript_52188:79-705(-)